MIPSAKKLLLAGGGRVKPQDVFATSLRTGTGARPRVVNGIDLLRKGGLVWAKDRNSSGRHFLVDTSRGGSAFLSSELANAETRDQNVTPTFYNDGFEGTGFSNGTTVVEWSFRRAKKFFDIVTYTGNGVAGRQITHGLGATPGMIVIKGRDSAARPWIVYHRSLTGSNVLLLNSQNGQSGDAQLNPGGHTSSYFVVGGDGNTNTSGEKYVAYIFAQNPDLIDCGNYVGNGSTSGPVVTCGSGWKPQWLLIKSAGGGTDWIVLDTARDPVNPVDGALRPNNPQAELTGWPIDFLPIGFQPRDTRGDLNSNGAYIYLAIRSPT